MGLPGHRRALLVLCAVLGCSQAATGDGEAAEPAQRVITLAPHLTELVFTAGGGERLVGVVEYSDFPEQAKSLPRIGDAFRLDMERIVMLDPDLILAWASGNPRQMIDALDEMGFRVAVLETDSLDSIAGQLEYIGRLLGTETLAEEAAGRFTDGLAELAEQYSEASPIRVFYQISERPLYTVNGDHPISQMIALCGGRNVFAELGSLAPTVSPEAVVSGDPEVILTGLPGALDKWRRYAGLSATRIDGLYTVSADLVTRASTRMLDGARQICDALDRGRLARAGAP